MNDGTIDLFTLLALIAAVVVALKLRSVLGQRTDDDDARVERRMQEREYEEDGQGQSDNIVTLPHARRDHDETGQEPEKPSADEMRERIAKVAKNDPRLTKGLEAIHAIDADFDPEHFLDGAKQAYEMIVTAFADGNLKALKDYLSDDVYRSFEAAINEREDHGIIMDQTFVGIKKADMIEAEIEDGNANIAVHFGSEMISVSRDKDGEIRAGDPNEVEDITDIWTFARDISTERARANPNWKLVATQAPN